MRTSERLDKIAEALSEARKEMRRLMVDLPTGASLEVLDSCEARTSYVIALLGDESRELRKWND
jgi:hypothetical protein